MNEKLKLVPENIVVAAKSWHWSNSSTTVPIVSTIAKTSTTKNLWYKSDIYDYRMAFCYAVRGLQNFCALLVIYDNEDTLRDNVTRVNLAKEAVKELLDSHDKFSFSLNYHDEEGNTPLHYLAICEGEESEELLERIVKKGANLTIKNKNNQTPMSFAIQKNFWNLVTIIANNRKLNNSRSHQSQDSHQYGYALFYAVLKNEKTAALALLNANTPLMNNVDQSGKSLLELAIDHANIDVIKLLIERGADLSEKNKDGFTAIEYAAINNKWAVVKTIAQQTPTKNTFFKKDTYGFQKALAIAIEVNQTDAAILLIKNSANLFAKNKNGQTALDLIARYKHTKIVNFLLESMLTDSFSISDKHIEKLIQSTVQYSSPINFDAQNSDEEIQNAQDYYFLYANFFFNQTDPDSTFKKNKTHYFNAILFSLLSGYPFSVRPIILSSYLQFTGVSDKKYFDINYDKKNKHFDISHIIKNSRFDKKTIEKNILELINQLKPFASNNNIIMTEIGKLYYFLGNYPDAIRYLTQASYTVVKNSDTNDDASHEAFDTLASLATLCDDKKPEHIPDSAYQFSVKNHKSLFVFRDIKNYVETKNLGGLKKALQSPLCERAAIAYLEAIVSSDNNYSLQAEEAAMLLANYYYKHKNYEQAVHWGFFAKPINLLNEHQNALLYSSDILNYLSYNDLQDILTNNKLTDFPDQKALLSILEAKKSAVSYEYRKLVKFIIAEPRFISRLSFQNIFNLLGTYVFSRNGENIYSFLSSEEENILFSELIKNCPIDLIYSKYAYEIPSILTSWDNSREHENDTTLFNKKSAAHFCDLKTEIDKLEHWFTVLGKDHFEKIITRIRLGYHPNTQHEIPKDQRIKKILAILYGYILTHQDNPNVKKLLETFECSSDYLSDLYPLFKLIDKSETLNNSQKDKWKKSVREYAYKILEKSTGEITNTAVLQQRYSKAINDPVFAENRNSFFNAIGVQSNTTKEILKKQHEALDDFFNLLNGNTLIYKIDKDIQTKIINNITKKYQSSQSIFASEESKYLINILNNSNYDNHLKIDTIRKFMIESSFKNKTLYKIIQKVFIDYLSEKYKESDKEKESGNDKSITASSSTKNVTYKMI
jgi:ankyrin repeat protein